MTFEHEPDEARVEISLIPKIGLTQGFPGELRQIAAQKLSIRCAERALSSPRYLGRKDARHRLPGPLQGSDFYWDVTTAGREETILVIASVKTLAELESKLAVIPRVASTHPLPVQPQEIADSLLRGIGELSPGPLEAPSPGPGYLSQVFRDLSSRTSGSSGVWFWEVQLENPAS